MNGRAHLLSGIFLLAPVLLAFNARGELSLLQTILAGLGIFLGIIAPDFDVGALSMSYRPLGFYGKKRETSFAVALDKLAGTLGWIFSNISRFFFFEPLVLFLHVAGYKGIAKHRGVMHSLFAALLCSCFWVFVLLVGSLIAGVGPQPAFAFGVGLLVGFLFHLYCDSLTPHGVNWMFPHEFVVHGKIRTGSELYGKGVKFIESQLFALAAFALSGIALLWLLLYTAASAGFIALLAGFELLVLAGLLGMEVRVEEFGNWRSSQN